MIRRITQFLQLQSRVQCKRCWNNIGIRHQQLLIICCGSKNRANYCFHGFNLSTAYLVQRQMNDSLLLLFAVSTMGNGEKPEFKTLSERKFPVSKRHLRKQAAKKETLWELGPKTRHRSAKFLGISFRFFSFHPLTFRPLC